MAAAQEETQGGRERQNGWLFLYGAKPKSLAAKDGAKTIQVATGVGDVTNPVSTNNQSKIYII
jgi:hypothetical protein